MMSDSWLMPKGADLLSAVRWLSEQHRHDRQAIEEASLRAQSAALREIVAAEERQLALTDSRRKRSLRR
jgi:hypothetical protein